MEFYRSALVRTPDGLLTCEDDIEGRDTATLDRLGQEATAAAIADLHRLKREPR